MTNQIEIPDEWIELDAGRWQGPILILGAPSTGKSTFARALFRQLIGQQEPVAYLDADVGQQELGLPATISVALSASHYEGFPPSGRCRMSFVGSNSPRGHFVPLLLSLHRLQQFAVQCQAAATVIDTSGFVDVERGAAVLKWAKIDLLQPTRVVAFQRQGELEPILAPLRSLLEGRLHILPVPAAVSQRPAEKRQAYRADRFRTYFQDAQTTSLPFGHLAVFPKAVFEPGQLLALEDRDGFAVALGVVKRANYEEQKVQLHTPWAGGDNIQSLRLGDLQVDLQTYEDRRH
jgi:polynucleotide 5'-hydroxyl-kinase GRC3/NOL9